MPLNIDIQQILLHLFNLVLLFGILYLLLYKPVHDFMDKREEEYRKRDEKTKDALSDAEKLKAEYEEKVARAEKENAETRASISAAAESDRERIITDAHEKASKIIDDARVKAQSEHDRLIARAQTEITEYVSKAAAKIVMDNDGLEDDFDSFFESVDKQDIVQKDKNNG
ncbi:MAG: ATP synthase F0 subunit B [Lachnospiraceae bacterium]|nr:ATP synthase F0 subunit B [Lachnospiraceae bacterium]